MSFAVQQVPVAVALADLNGDGLLDFAVATNSGVSVLLATGPAAFGTATTTSINTPCRDVAAIDLNGDGRPDLLATTQTGLAVALNTSK
jgi:hypothetical protein